MAEANDSANERLVLASERKRALNVLAQRRYRM
jgi:hypothetical protein